MKEGDNFNDPPKLDNTPNIADFVGLIGEQYARLSTTLQNHFNQFVETLPEEKNENDIQFTNAPELVQAPPKPQPRLDLTPEQKQMVGQAVYEHAKVELDNVKEQRQSTDERRHAVEAIVVTLVADRVIEDQVLKVVQTQERELAARGGGSTFSPTGPGSGSGSEQEKKMLEEEEEQGRKAAHKETDEMQDNAQEVAEREGESVTEPKQSDKTGIEEYTNQPPIEEAELDSETPSSAPTCKPNPPGTNTG